MAATCLTWRPDHLDRTRGCAAARRAAWGNEPASRCPATAPACRPRSQDRRPPRLGPSRSEGGGASAGSSRENRPARAACVGHVVDAARTGSSRRTAPALPVLAVRDHGRRSAPQPAAPPLRPLAAARARTHVRDPLPAAAAVAVLRQPEPVACACALPPSRPRPARSSPASPGGPAPRPRAVPGRTALSTPLPAGTPRLDPRSRTAGQGSRRPPTRSLRPTPTPGNCPLPPPPAGPQGTLSGSPETWPAVAKGPAEPELVPKAARRAAEPFPGQRPRPGTRVRGPQRGGAGPGCERPQQDLGLLQPLQVPLPLPGRPQLSGWPARETPPRQAGRQLGAGAGARGTFLSPPEWPSPQRHPCQLPASPHCLRGAALAPDV